mgnify:CR=1 FL=1
MKSYIHSIKNLILAAIIVTLAGCSSYYDHYTLTETVASQAMAQNLLNHATEPYQDHRAAIDAFEQQLDKMLIYEQTKDRNQIMLQMWTLLNNPDSSVQQFIKTWEDQGSMSPVFVEEYRPQVLQLFQLMIDYENKKDRQSENALLQLLQTVNP